MSLAGNCDCLEQHIDFFGPQKSRFQGPPLIMAHGMDIAHLKIIMYRAIKITGTLIVITGKLTDWPGFLRCGLYSTLLHMPHLGFHYVGMTLGLNPILL
jgi:hypothetical protein